MLNRWALRDAGSGVYSEGDIVREILRGRNTFSSDGEIEKFLHVDIETPPIDYHSDHVLTDMPVAAERILRAVRQSEPILVYGDFDVDGITSTALLTMFLKQLRAQVYAYIPSRVDEGYGLNVEAVKKFSNAGIGLIVTVDVGTRDIEAVSLAKSLGMDVVVTDHHSLGDETPVDALAFVNPQRDNIDELCHICGAAVAYLLAIAILRKIKDDSGSSSRFSLEFDHLISTFDDLVGIATVADVMDLSVPINRRFVQRGFASIRSNPRVGLASILQKAKIEHKDVDAQAVGFTIGPRLNAAGRVGDVNKALQLLMSSDRAESDKLAQELETYNYTRQKESTSAFNRAVAQIEGGDFENAPVIVVWDELAHMGVVGLVASKLAERYSKPAIVLQRGEVESRGSCRSVEGFDIMNVLTAVAEQGNGVIRYGGHKLAAGLSVVSESLETFAASVTQFAAGIEKDSVLQAGKPVDLELTFDQITESLYHQLVGLEPVGHGNPPPVFLTRNLQVLEWRSVGTNHAHLKVTLRSRDSSRPPMSGIAFGLGRLDNGTVPDMVNVIYQIQINEWNNTRSLQMLIKDIEGSTR